MSFAYQLNFFASDWAKKRIKWQKFNAAIVVCSQDGNLYIVHLVARGLLSTKEFVCSLVDVWICCVYIIYWCDYFAIAFQNAHCWWRSKCILFRGFFFKIKREKKWNKRRLLQLQVSHFVENVVCFVRHFRACGSQSQND